MKQFKSLFAVAAITTMAFAAGCGDGKKAVGEPCTTNDDCQSGLCEENDDGDLVCSESSSGGIGGCGTGGTTAGRGGGGTGGTAAGNGGGGSGGTAAGNGGGGSGGTAAGNGGGGTGGTDGDASAGAAVDGGPDAGDVPDGG